jgi:hypothetical protein
MEGVHHRPSPRGEVDSSSTSSAHPTDFQLGSKFISTGGLRPHPQDVCLSANAVLTVLAMRGFFAESVCGEEFEFGHRSVVAFRNSIIIS